MIHRGISFEEKPVMKKYIDLNTKLRANSKPPFEKDFIKLMNNTVYGKTLENIRKRVNVKLVSDRGKALKLAAKPNFENVKIFDENLIAIHMKRKRLTFNKAIYCGMSILDISKTLMYVFHYKYMKPKYGHQAALLFTYTDSLCYEIGTDDFHKDIRGDLDVWFDTSNFAKDHTSGIQIDSSKKVHGKFKDEAGGKIIEEFLGLRAKLYSYNMFEGG